MNGTSLDKVALITGASSGIGKATAYAFGRMGYATVLADVDAEAGEQAAAELRAEERQSLFVHCDVANAAQVDRFVSTAVERFGRIDAAFNNAGIEGMPGSTDVCSVANWRRIIDVNLTGVWLCMRAQLQQMLRQTDGGSIVNCSSVAGLIGLPNIPAYVASKHGVIGLTKSAALEHATHGIRINAVCPGAIETPMLERYMGSMPDGRRQLVETEPMHRIGTPSEIAEAVVWLCSGGASFITGQAIAIDGGWTAR